MLRYFYMALPCLLLVACGQSADGLKFFEAARRQYSLDNEALLLFARGPTWDGTNPEATAKTSINLIPRSYMPLLGLSSLTGPLQGFHDDINGYGLKVQYSSTNSSSPIFNNWAGKDIEWNSKEFKAFMLYSHMAKVHELVFDNIPRLQTLITSHPERYPLRGVAATSGHVLNTAFSYGASTGSVINFYQHNKAGLEKLNMVDEGDAIYHEFAHYIQYLFNSTVLNTAVSNVEAGTVVNQDLDAIIEGTADYLSAAVTKTERIHVYLENNMPLIKAGTIVREGTYNRSISKSWGFPETFVFQSHLDGRVIAAAVNDLRKYISNQDIAIRGCTPAGSAGCSVNVGFTVTGVSDMWIKTFELSMLAFEDLTSTSTYRDYARKLIDEAETFMIAQGCTGACATALRVDLTKLFKGRGLIEADSVAPITVALTAGATAATPIKYGTSFNFVPFEVSQGLSNDDNKLSECEIAMVMPDITNNTDVVGPATDLYNIYYRVVSTTNLQEVKDANGAVIDYLSGTNRKWKAWGVLAPGKRGLDGVATSTSSWYTTTNGSHFSAPASLSNFPVYWGYMVSVPRNRATQTITINWQVVMYPKNASSTLLKTTISSITQSLVIDDNLTFCD